MEYNKEKEAYINLLKKCVTDSDFFDEGLVKYLLEYKKEYIYDTNFIDWKGGSIIYTDLWGYIKTKEKKEDNIIKWSKLLNKEIHDNGIYKYLKFRFSDYSKIDQEYKPFYFKEEKDKDIKMEVSLNFLNIVGVTENNNYKIEKLTETEHKLLFNELLYDNPIKSYIRIEQKEGYDNFFQDFQEFIIDNFEIMIKIANEKSSKNSILRLLSQSCYLLENIFQEIPKKELEKIINNNNYEDKFLTYINYKNVSTSFYVHALLNYKNKDFWKKWSKCEKDNNFSILNAIKPIIDFKNLDKIYKDINPKNLTNGIGYEYGDNSTDSDRKTKDIMNVLNYYKEEIKKSDNYKEELEKLVIFSMDKENKELYKQVRNFVRENIDKDIIYESVKYKNLILTKDKFLEKIKEEDIMELNGKLSEDLKEKQLKEKKHKI